MKKENRNQVSTNWLGKMVYRGFFSILCFSLSAGFVYPTQGQTQNSNPTSIETLIALPTPGTVPAPPTNFAIEPGDECAHLSWDKMPNARAYLIYVSEDGKDFNLQFPNSNADVFNEANVVKLENGKKYYYAVASLGFDGQKSGMTVQSVVPKKLSVTPKWAIELTPKWIQTNAAPPDPKSEEYAKWRKKQKYIIQGTPGGIKNPEPQPDPPTNLKIEAGDSEAYLTWDPMPKAQSYVLFVSKDGIKYERQIKKPFKKTKITIRFLQNGKIYYFGVACVGAYGHKTNMSIQTVIPIKNGNVRRP